MSFNCDILESVDWCISLASTITFGLPSALCPQVQWSAVALYSIAIAGGKGRYPLYLQQPLKAINTGKHRQRVTAITDQQRPAQTSRMSELPV